MYRLTVFPGLFGQFWPGAGDVLQHRPQGQRGGDIQADEAQRVDRDAKQIITVDQQYQRDHLRNRLDLAVDRHGDLAAYTELGHPLAQCGDGNFPTDNDGSGQGQ